jgi:hypothetical protein
MKQFYMNRNDRSVTSKGVGIVKIKRLPMYRNICTVGVQWQLAKTRRQAIKDTQRTSESIRAILLVLGPRWYQLLSTPNVALNSR